MATTLHTNTVSTDTYNTRGELVSRRRASNALVPNSWHNTNVIPTTSDGYAFYTVEVTSAEGGPGNSVSSAARYRANGGKGLITFTLEQFQTLARISTITASSPALTYAEVDTTLLAQGLAGFTEKSYFSIPYIQEIYLYQGTTSINYSNRAGLNYLLVGRSSTGEILVATWSWTSFVEYVVRGIEEGSSGTGSGSSITEARVQEIIDATSLSALQGQVTDAQIPDAVMRDAEFTAAAVRTLLSLTATEVDDLLTGASVSGQILTFTQNDGTVTTVTLPQSSGTADGVVASGAFNSGGTELVLTLDTGTLITVSVPSLLRSTSGVTETRVQELINATNLSALQGQVTDLQIPSTLMRDSEFTAATVRTLLGLTAAEVNDLLVGGSITNRTLTFTQNDGSDISIQLPADADTQDGVVASGAFNSAGTELTLTLADSSTVVVSVPSVLRTGTGSGLDEAAVDARIAAKLTAAVTNNTETGIEVVFNSDGTLDFIVASAAPQTHINYIAISADDTFTEAEFLDGNTSMTTSLIVPTYSGVQRFIAIAVPDAEGDITNITQGGLSTFGVWVRVTGTINISSVAHKVWRTSVDQNDLASGITYVIVQ